SLQAQCQTRPARVPFPLRAPFPPRSKKGGEGAEAAPSPELVSPLSRSRHGDVPQRRVQAHILPDGGDPPRSRQPATRRAPNESAPEHPLLDDIQRVPEVITDVLRPAGHQELRRLHRPVVVIWKAQGVSLIGELESLGIR